MCVRACVLVCVRACVFVLAAGGRQVLVSIQSLIFVPDPYFNEPGLQARARLAPGGEGGGVGGMGRMLLTVGVGGVGGWVGVGWGGLGG